MSGLVFIKPKVYFDLDELAAWIQRDSPQVALRFLDQTDVTFQSLADMPGIGSPYAVQNPRLAELRCFPIKGFSQSLGFLLADSRWH
jgi:toxin ParE1/3/4